MTHERIFESEVNLRHLCLNNLNRPALIPTEFSDDVSSNCDPFAGTASGKVGLLASAATNAPSSYPVLSAVSMCIFARPSPLPVLFGCTDQAGL